MTSLPDTNQAMSLWTAGLGALLVSIGVGMTSNLLFLRRFSFASIGSWSRHGFSVPVRPPAELLLWAAVLDLIGYYLAPAVLAYVLWRRLRPRNPLIADLSVQRHA